MACSLIFSLAPKALAAVQEGSQLIVNGQPFSGAWAAWTDPQSGKPALGLSDSAWMRVLGGDLADSQNPAQQPVLWYSAAPTLLSTKLSLRGARYLNIAEVARQWGWQLQPSGETLSIQTPATAVQSLRLGQQSWGRRLVITLDRPTPWTLATLTNSRSGRTDRRFEVQIDATLPAGALQDYGAAAGAGLKALKVVPGSNQFSIQGTVDGTYSPQISTLSNPPRLVLDIRQAPTKARSIQWAPGLLWREGNVNLGKSQFPVTWLALNLRTPGLKLQPLWGSGTALVGINPLANIALINQAVAVINGGFFTRDRQMPLGAIRHNGTWISSPILNRGAVGWTPQGQIKVGRLMLQESLTTSQGNTVAIASSNSGYPQKGIARYTSVWGASYTPILENEQIITVIGNQIQSQQAGKGLTVPIPSDGALLVLRSVAVPPGLSPGSQIQYLARPSLPEFEAFPNILGAGPLLIDNGRIGLDALGEQFSPTFATQFADRSGIGQTADGTVLLAAAHNRVGGPGPSLGEWAQIMQQLGAVNALNLDGGSSTALYLGGQLLDRHPKTAARVQNGIGVFLPPSLP